MQINGRPSYKTARTMLETLMECPHLTDDVFNDIIGDYETDEDTAMELMVTCDKGEFRRTDNGWVFTEK